MDELSLEQAAELLGISPQYFRRCHEALGLHPSFTLEKLAPYLEPRLTGALPDDVKAMIASLMPPRTPAPQPGRSPAGCGHAFEAAWPGWKFKPQTTVRSYRGQR